LLLLVGEEAHRHEFLEKPEVSLLQVILLLIAVDSVQNTNEQPFQAVVHFNTVLPSLGWVFVSLLDSVSFA
jgi:hypothetical protein